MPATKIIMVDPRDPRETTGYRRTCPHCKRDLRRAPDPEHPDEPGAYIQAVTIYRVYPGTLFYQCLLCGGNWHRWSTDQMRLRLKACPYVYA